METRKQLIERLESLGVTGVAALAIARETGAARHAARVEAAKAAARRVGAALLGVPSGESGDGTMTAVDLAGAFVCALDSFGLGGADGVEGRATARVAAFGALGKGRKQASDGPAWSAAISAAGNHLAAWLVIAPRRDGGVVLWDGPREPEKEVVIDLSAIRREGLELWLVTLLREGLRVSLGLTGWFDWSLTSRSGSPPGDWGGALNRVVSDIEDTA